MTLKGPKIDWDFISTWSFRIFMTGSMIGGMYAASIYTTKADAQSMVAPFTTLPARVDTIEKAGTRRDSQLQDLDNWRRVKDDTITRLTVLQENQQQLLTRQQQMMDRQQNQIDDLNRNTVRRP